MAIKIKAQKVYLVTETTIEVSSDVAEVHDEVRAEKTDGKMNVVYCGGGVQGVNVEQKTRVPEALAAQFKKKLGIEETII